MFYFILTVGSSASSLKSPEYINSIQFHCDFEGSNTSYVPNSVNRGQGQLRYNNTWLPQNVDGVHANSFLYNVPTFIDFRMDSRSNSALVLEKSK
jgi:hypothetical protein